MPTQSGSYQLHLFILRLWPEVVDHEQVEWRGEIKNTSTGEVRYFRDWHALVDLLPQLLEEEEAHRRNDDSA